MTQYLYCNLFAKSAKRDSSDWNRFREKVTFCTLEIDLSQTQREREREGRS